MLARLEREPVKVDAKVFDSYVGEYEVSPTFLRIFREGEKFLTQATGQPVLELLPEAEDKF